MNNRIVCQFSCGAASAVATKLALAEFGTTHDVQIINAYLANEHDDNRRFAQDCEAWFGRPITVLRDDKYGADILQVFHRERFMKGRNGAPCTKLLKRRLLDIWKQPGDVMVFGYTAEEVDRLEDFRERNPDRPVIAPLIDAGLGKEDCKAMVLRAGIELPLMYRLGYDNANCIGCVKGGEGISGRSAKTSRISLKRCVRCRTTSARVHTCFAIAPPTCGFPSANWAKARCGVTRKSRPAHSSARWQRPTSPAHPNPNPPTCLPVSGGRGIRYVRRN